MRILALLLFTLTIFVACERDATAQATHDYVQFKIVPIKAHAEGDDELTWQASYGTDENFIISFKQGDMSQKGVFAFSKGSIRHVAGSNAKIFLKELSLALGAKAVPRIVKRTELLTFDIAVLGTHQTRFSDGGFASKPVGNWIASKIFLANGAGEVYLNFDPVLGVGEFSLKDEAYGNIVLRELASVL